LPAQTGVVRPAAVSLVLCLTSACVGTNPRWDPPDETSDATPTGTAGDAGDGDASSEASVVGASSGVDDPTTGGDAADGTSTSASDVPECPEDEALCAGACTKIAEEKKACGTECIDCTTLYGDDARCREGVCEPKDGDDD